MLPPPRISSSRSRWRACCRQGRRRRRGGSCAAGSVVSMLPAVRSCQPPSSRRRPACRLRDRERGRTASLFVCVCNVRRKGVLLSSARRCSYGITLYGVILFLNSGFSEPRLQLVTVVRKKLERRKRSNIHDLQHGMKTSIDEKSCWNRAMMRSD